jgi:uncharacterized protein (DUF2235 family)
MKKIVLFADGTGNAFTTQESNVARIFQALDNSEYDQITCYIKGVGTSGFRPWAIFDGATGVGVPSNVRKLYQFLCWNYEEGAEVYMFGFSRGAFTIRTLIRMIESQGLIASKFRDQNEKEVSLSHEEMQRRSRDAYRAYRDEVIKSWTFIQTPLFLHVVRGFRALADMYNKVTGRKKAPYENIEKHELNSIEFVGLFDTVEAFGVPLVELRIAIDRVIWPISFRNNSLPKMARVVRHALSLDDERTTFHPIRIEEIDEAEPGVSLPPSDRIKEVWFAGVDSDVGGGYPDSALSHVPLIWMLEELARATDGLRFRAGAIDGFRGAASAFGPLHDSRRGLGATYRYNPRSFSGKQTNGKDFPPPLVHYSVVERMVLGADNYAPITLSSDARLVFPDGREEDIVLVAGKDSQTVYHDRPTFDALKRLSKPNRAYTDLALDKVWWRQVNYFAMVACLVLLALSPLIAEPIFAGMKDDLFFDPRALAANTRAVADLPAPSTEWMATVVGWLKVLLKGVFALPYVFSGVVDELKSILPSYAAWHLNTLKTHPVPLLLLIIVTGLLYRQSGKLQGEIQDYARKAWSFKGRHVAKARDRPAESKTGWLKGLTQKGRVRNDGADGDSEGQAQEAQTDGRSAAIPESTLFTRFANRARTSTASKLFHLYGTAFLSLLWSLILAFTVVVTPVVALSRIVFNFRIGRGVICTPTAREDLQWISAASPSLENTSFKTSDVCWASGFGIENGGACRVTIKITEPWFDRTIMTDVGGFEGDTLVRKIFKAPFLRWPFAGWFQPVARIGGDGDIDWPLVSNDGSGPLPIRGKKCTRMPIAYEDTQEFCDAHRNEPGKCSGKVIMDTKNEAPLSYYDPLPESEMTTATEAWNSSGKSGDGNPCKSIYPRRTFVSDFVAQKSGELFLFVNDDMPVLGFGSINQFYRNNRGAATVTLQRVPLSAPPKTD